MVKRRGDWGGERKKGVSHFLFVRGSTLVLCGFAALPPRMLLIYCDSKEKYETARRLCIMQRI